MDRQRAAELLGCRVEDLVFTDGLNKPGKNRIAKVGDALVVTLGLHTKVAILDDSDNVRRLLASGVLSNVNGYAVLMTKIEKGRYQSSYIHNVLVPTVPGEVIEHINRELADNRMVNLRVIKHGAARHVRAARRGNPVGMCGVSQVVVNGITYFRAVATDPVTKAQLTKSFSSKKYGLEEARRMAIDQRRQWVEELYGAPAE